MLPQKNMGSPLKITFFVLFLNGGLSKWGPTYNHDAHMTIMEITQSLKVHNQLEVEES